ncbi:MAG: TesB-like acyl-CoA thioesterase 1, partial [Myxococcaceae bacterium]|nr:TesB-like acyl-CoA thioesterase 1 [Myxococcaceae bacterium]
TRAMEEVNAQPEWPLRILNGEILAPVMIGPTQIEVEVLRRSSGVATFSSRLLQHGHLLARATGIFGKQRVADRERMPVDPPSPPRWESVEPVPRDGPMFPVFARQFEFRPTGALPFSGADRPHAAGWICPREASRGLGAAEAVAMADAWWPADFATESAPRPMSTIAFTLELLQPLSGAPMRPLFHRATVPASHDGFSLELRELWDEQGRIVALNQQTFVFVR